MINKTTNPPRRAGAFALPDRPHVARQQLRLRRFLMAACCAAMFCLLELVLYVAGLMPGSAVLQADALAMLASGVFFLIFRVGLNERARDPSLTGPMMTVATAILLYTMAIAPVAMQTFGIYLGVIILFGVFRFSGRALLGYAIGSLLAYGVTVGWVELRSNQPRTALALDLARWLVFAGTLPIFAWVGGHINRFRVRMDERKRFYQAIWDACIDVIVVVDRAGNVVHANPAADRAFGRPPEALVGQSLAMLEPPGTRGAGALSRIALQPRPGRGTETAETMGWHAAGRALPIEATFSNVVLDGNEVVVGFLRDITERKLAEERIRYVASHDALTDLPNRTLLTDRLNQAIAMARRSETAVWVAFLDLDRFKLINDSLGHAAGDALLTAVAARLRVLVRETDTVARLGGDEFVLVLTEPPGSRLSRTVLQRVTEAVAQPLNTHGHELLTTCSVGVAVFPDDGEDASTLIQRADITMYRAKQAGRNGFCFYAASMNARALERLRLERELRVALDEGQFFLEFQPQVEVATRHIVGAEALVRWQHPGRGVVPPGEFIGVAEELGLIVPLGRWIIRSACLQARAWQRPGLPPVRVAVNLSPRQFAERGLAGMIAGELAAASLAAPLLEVEITESLLMSDVDRAVDTLHELNQLGVKVSIDDFGTGYSSLAYLKRFPIDTLKIDRSFVRDIVTDPEDAAIVGAIISLAHNLGHTVTAEGVEDRTQLDFLVRHRCDYAQGYLFSRPLSATRFEEFLERTTDRHADGRTATAPAPLTSAWAAL